MNEVNSNRTVTSLVLMPDNALNEADAHVMIFTQYLPFRHLSAGGSGVLLCRSGAASYLNCFRDCFV